MLNESGLPSPTLAGGAPRPASVRARGALLLAALGVWAPAGWPADAPESAPPALVITDLRPAAEKGTQWLSYLITSCNYGVRQIGDRDLRVDRVASLQDALRDARAAELAGRTVTLLHYGIHVNNAEHARQQAADTFNHGNRGVMTTVGSHCRKEQMEAGWYAPGELASAYSPIIVEITLAIDGESHTVRSVYSPDREFDQRLRRPESVALVAAAMQQAERAVVAALAQ
jgi:hypothetical protein